MTSPVLVTPADEAAEGGGSGVGGRETTPISPNAIAMEEESERSFWYILVVIDK
jgi:hypothetical protein